MLTQQTHQTQLAISHEPSAMSHFLIYALASCDETLVHLDFIENAGYISTDQCQDYKNRYDVLGKKINAYTQKVMKSHLSPKDKISN